MDKPSFSPEFWQELADHNPLGMRLTWEEARDWFDLVWLKYSTYRYTKHRKAIINWWSRVREEDIEKARERVRRIADETETARLESLAQKQRSKVVPIDYAARLRRR